MDWYQILFELIDMRSFSNLWFWIVLAVVWSTASHWVIGVPYDMVLRARRQGGQAQVDLEDMVRIMVNRMMYIGQLSGLWLLGFGCFGLTMLGLLAFTTKWNLHRRCSCWPFRCRLSAFSACRPPG